ncbi:MAG: ATP-dependent nuclease [Candidatus Dormibacteria bacterium]
MSVKSITLRNYRTFGAQGVTLPLGQEFLAIIGVNNSGKTALLRSLYELRQIFGTIATWSTGTLNLDNFLANGTAIPLTLQPGERIVPVGDPSLEPRVEIAFSSTPTGPLTISRLVIVIIGQGIIRGKVVLTDGTEIGLNPATTAVASASAIHPTLQIATPSGETRQIDWAPVQAGLRSLAGMMYVGPFRNVINTGGAGYYDITVGQQFIEQFDEFKTGSNPVANESITTLIQELAEIFSLRSLEVSASPKKDQLVVQVNGKSFRGTELGSGMTQFVIVATNVLVRRPTFLLIDEPELNLHASLQLRFLTLLARYASQGVIFATHSLGLARSAADQVLVATREGDWTVLEEYQAVPSLSSALGELGYGGLNDSAFKAVLLVEGVTDVRTFQQLLSKYGVSNEVVIVALGGDDLTSSGHDQELTELKRLSDNVFAIVDSERTGPEGDPEPRREEFRKTCERLGIRCHLLGRRAIENYLDQDVAREVNRQPNALPFADFDKPGSTWSWAKARNWRIAMEMKRDQLVGTDLDVQLHSIAATVAQKDSE